jgi:hypothetical protein
MRAGERIHPEVPTPYPETDAMLFAWIDLSECPKPYLQFSHQYEFYGLERLTNEGWVELLVEGGGDMDPDREVQYLLFPVEDRDLLFRELAGKAHPAQVRTCHQTPLRQAMGIYDSGLISRIATRASGSSRNGASFPS